MAVAADKFDVSLFAYCLMPNHWHLIISPHCDGGLSRCMHWLTTTHARRWHLHRGDEGDGAVYQGRYKAIPIQADRHFLATCRYVERNALRAGLASRAEHWPWGSAFARERDSLARLAAWPVPQPGEWLDYLNTPQTDAEISAIRRAVVHNVPFGDGLWSTEIATRLRLKLRGPGMSPDPLTDLYS